LLVEDERGLSDNLARYLGNQGFNLEVVETLSAARVAMNNPPDLVILDWMLPDGNGIELIQEWRKKELLIPVILLTAKTELIDKILGLELGANDYLTKPFEPRELVARINAQLRTFQSLGRNSGSTRPRHGEESLSASNIQLNAGTREVHYHGDLIELTPMEFNLLRVFMESPNHVFSRSELLDEVWGYKNFPTTRTVDNHVSNLRKKISPELFEIVYRVGYRFISTNANSHGLPHD
jgi:DNA-binding response OmpR family regulator